MARKLTKILTLGVMVIMALGLFAGCGGNKLSIKDFEGLSDLPANPDRIVFMTDQLSEDGMQIDKIEVDIPEDKISYVMDTLFSRTYKGLSKNIQIDMTNDYLKVYQGEKCWQFHISLMHSNERWYSPLREDDLRNYLFSLI